VADIGKIFLNSGQLAQRRKVVSPILFSKILKKTVIFTTFAALDQILAKMAIVSKEIIFFVKRQPTVC
jgi:hypothetical protein